MNKVIEEYLKSFDNLERYVLDIAPNTKPRMTAKDCHRPNHKKYWAYKENIQYEAAIAKLKDLPGLISFIIFYVPIPKKVTNVKKHKGKLEDVPVLAVPDVDNYQKALQDCLAKQDNYIHTVGMTKRYSDNPRIEIFVNKEMNKEMDAWLKELYKEVKLK